jgi:hypothetical protein
MCLCVVCVCVCWSNREKKKNEGKDCKKVHKQAGFLSKIKNIYTFKSQEAD